MDEVTGSAPINAEDEPPPELMEWMRDAHRQMVDRLPERTEASLTNLLLGTMLAEVFGHFLAVMALLRERLVSQAMILNRGLVEMTTLLAYMSLERVSEEEVALRYWWRATNRELELVREGGRVHDVDVTDRLRALQEELSAVEAEAKRLGIEEVERKLPSTGDMAAKLSKASRAMKHGIDLMSLHVHSSRSPLSRRLHSGDGHDVAGSFSPREAGREWHVQAGVMATVAMADAVSAVARLQTWASADEVAEMANEVGKGWPPAD